MTARVSIPKSVRFEVFKRDSFKCQYCGACAPDVLLHVDHIRPVADGGLNDIANLITSCQPCNLGKGARKLSDNSALDKSRRQMDELQDRREQLELMMEWQRGLAGLKDEEVSIVAERWSEVCPGYHLNETGLLALRKLLKKFGLQMVVQAMGIAADSYLQMGEAGKPTHDSVNIAWSKIGGICEIERRSKDKPYLKDLYYIRAILRKRLEGRYYCNYQAIQFLENAYLDGVNCETLKSIVLDSWSWTKFVDQLVDARAEASK